MSILNKNSLQTKHINLISDETLSFSSLSANHDNQIDLYSNLKLTDDINVVNKISCNNSIPITGYELGKDTIIYVDRMLPEYNTIKVNNYSQNGKDYQCMGIFKTKNLTNGFWYMVQAFITPDASDNSTGTSGKLISGIFCYNKISNGSHMAWVIHNNYVSNSDQAYSIRIYPLDSSSQIISSWSDATDLGFYIFRHYSWEGGVEQPAKLYFITLRALPLRFPVTSIGGSN